MYQSVSGRSEPAGNGAHLGAPTFAPALHSYDEREVITYALAVGCGPEELRFVYERGLEVLPTFAVVPAFPALATVVTALQLDPLNLLHTQHRLELLAPLPCRETIVTQPSLEAIYESAVGAMVVVAADSTDRAGRLLCRNRATLLARGRRDLGGTPGYRALRPAPPARPPDASVAMQTRPEQALLYRLLGDRNPLHADPEIALLAGFPRPILHGLCTFGFAGRALLRNCCCDRPARLGALEARFSGAVYPGESIGVDIWQTAPGHVAFIARTERGTAALSAGVAEILP